MSAFLAAFLASATLSPSAEIPSDQLVQTFEAACLDGSVSLTPGQASEILFDALPETLRGRLGKPISGHVWRLNSPGEAYLYTLNYEPGRITSRMICGLASDHMPLTKSAEALRARFGGAPLDETSPNTEWMFPEDGYFAAASRSSNFTHLQVRWLSDQQKRRALWEYRRIGVRVPKTKTGAK